MKSFFQKIINKIKKTELPEPIKEVNPFENKSLEELKTYSEKLRFDQIRSKGELRKSIFNELTKVKEEITKRESSTDSTKPEHQ